MSYLQTAKRNIKKIRRHLAPHICPATQSVFSNVVSGLDRNDAAVGRVSRGISRAIAMLTSERAQSDPQGAIQRATTELKALQKKEKHLLWRDGLG